jgi:hypothetical protein
VIDTRVVYRGDCLDQLSSEPRPSGSGLLPKLPDACVDRLNLWHRLPAGDPGSNRNCELFGGALSEPERQRAGLPRAFEDRHASTAAYIGTVRPCCVGIRHVLSAMELFALRRSPLTQYHARRSNSAIAFGGSEAANRKETV